MGVLQLLLLVLTPVDAFPGFPNMNPLAHTIRWLSLDLSLILIGMAFLLQYLSEDITSTTYWPF